MKLGHFDKRFIKNSRKKRSNRKKNVPLDLLKLHLNSKFDIRMDIIKDFFAKIRALSLFSKKGIEQASISPSTTPSCVPDYN